MDCLLDVQTLKSALKLNCLGSATIHYTFHLINAAEHYIYSVHFVRLFPMKAAQRHVNPKKLNFLGMKISRSIKRYQSEVPV